MKTFSTQKKSKFQKNMSFRSTGNELQRPQFVDRKRPRSLSPENESQEKREKNLSTGKLDDSAGEDDPKERDPYFTID